MIVVCEIISTAVLLAALLILHRRRKTEAPRARCEECNYSRPIPKIVRSSFPVTECDCILRRGEDVTIETVGILVSAVREDGYCSDYLPKVKTGGTNDETMSLGNRF